jgi:hypothetical protein
MTKITIDRATVEQALEALEAGPDVDPIFAGETEAAIRAELAEPVQEPVGYLPAYELDRLQSGHDGRLRSAKFGASVLDGDVAVYTAPVQRPAEPVQEPDNGGKTGWPPGLLQDDCRGLSKWLASRPDARQRLREALAEPVQEPDLWGAGYEAGYQAGIAERPAKPVARPLREGEVMGAYMDFDRNIANKSWSNAEYLIRFGLFVSECTVTPPAPDPALVAALAEPVQEPVKQCMAHGECFGGECIYTSPPQRKPLVDPAEYDDAGAAERYNRGLK